MSNAQSPQEAVQAWVEAHKGPEKRFKSYRQWCAAAGLSPGGLDTLRRGKIPHATTLAALAEAAGEHPASVLALAGLLETQDGKPALSGRELRLLEMYRGLAPRDQDAIVRVVAGLLGSDTKEEG